MKELMKFKTQKHEDGSTTHFLDDTELRNVCTCRTYRGKEKTTLYLEMLVDYVEEPKEETEPEYVTKQEFWNEIFITSGRVTDARCSAWAALIWCLLNSCGLLVAIILARVL